MWVLWAHRCMVGVLAVVAVSVRRVRLRWARRGRRTSVISVVTVIWMSMSVVHGRRGQRTSLIIVRMMVARVHGLGSVMRCVASLRRAVFGIHRSMRRARQWSPWHGLRSSKVGSSRHMSARVRVHVGGLRVVRVSLVRMRVVRVVARHVCKLV